MMKKFIAYPKTPLFLLSLLTLFFILHPVTSQAQRGEFITDNSVDAEIIPRLTLHEAEFGITTKEGSVDLMINGSDLIIQFNDRFLDEISDEIRSEAKPDESSHFSAVLRAMISSGVRTLLDRAIAIPISEIEEVYYENGKLFIINRDGKEMFDDLDIDDKKVMEDFTRRDARGFVAEIERRMF